MGKFDSRLMFAASDPDFVVAQIVIGGLVLAGIWLIVAWVRNAPIKPDPWDAAVETALQAEDATPICHRCLTPHSNEAWFCKHCGSAVGTYNNWMPYVCVFSQGEIFRNGVDSKLRASPLIIVGYLLYSFGNYFVFAPIYWFFFFKNLKRLKQESLKEPIEDAN